MDGKLGFDLNYPPRFDLNEPAKKLGLDLNNDPPVEELGFEIGSSSSAVDSSSMDVALGNDSVLDDDLMGDLTFGVREGLVDEGLDLNRSYNSGLGFERESEQGNVGGTIMDDGERMDFILELLREVRRSLADSMNDLDFMQLETDEEILRRGNPPAARLAVDELPRMMEEEIGGDALCVICNDGILNEEGTKRLPCLHYYHGECIVPWLSIRNTCPLCRFELPSDDPEYELGRMGEADMRQL